ncbi:hypothetical protein CCMA1212_010055 [Trichoderma ghanense]|uniref:SSCRP protein n=1 Tax=Trichoderma ghanense TaxID=65468 RepID=A0ABY2GRC6_9HYPO
MVAAAASSQFAAQPVDAQTSVLLIEFGDVPQMASSAANPTAARTVQRTHPPSPASKLMPCFDPLVRRGWRCMACMAWEGRRAKDETGSAQSCGCCMSATSHVFPAAYLPSGSASSGTSGLTLARYRSTTSCLLLYVSSLLRSHLVSDGGSAWNPPLGRTNWMVAPWRRRLACVCRRRNRGRRGKKQEDEKKDEEAQQGQKSCERNG